MANICQVCNKGVIFGHNVSRSNRRTKRRWLPNLHKKRVVLGSRIIRIRVCTKCLRKIKAESEDVLKQLKDKF
jgi:large subunit ribosomal protein L28